MKLLASALSLDWVAGSEQLDRDVSEVKAVSMEGGNFLQVLNEGALVIVSGDRSDALRNCEWVNGRQRDRR